MASLFLITVYEDFLVPPSLLKIKRETRLAPCYLILEYYYACPVL